MPFAANGKISADSFYGAIKITEQQYAEALNGMCNGLVVTIDDGFKVAPPRPPEVVPSPEPTPEELAQLAFAQRDQLLSTAAIRIAPLQYAVELDRATPETVALLTLWKGYSVGLSEIAKQEGFPQAITWPLAPGEQGS